MVQTDHHKRHRTWKTTAMPEQNTTGQGLQTASPQYRKHSENTHSQPARTLPTETQKQNKNLHTIIHLPQIHVHTQHHICPTKALDNDPTDSPKQTATRLTNAQVPPQNQKNIHVHHTHYTTHHWTRKHPGQAKGPKIKGTRRHTTGGEKTVPCIQQPTGHWILYNKGRKARNTTAPRIQQPTGHRILNNETHKQNNSQLASSRTTGHRFTKDASKSSSLEFISYNMLVQTRTVPTGIQRHGAKTHQN